MRRGLFILSWCSLLLVAFGLSAHAAPKRVLTVFAASSLTDFMEDAKTAFEKAHPDVDVRVNTAGSSELRIQIQAGAPCDVFLAADTANMDPLKSTKAVTTPKIFAHNTLAIVVARRSKEQVKCPADLSKAGLRLAMAGPSVPVGRYTRQMLDKAEVRCGKNYSEAVLKNVKSEEGNVRAVLTKVILGEVDAGVVYSTDIAPDLQKSLQVITIPAEYNVVASYPIATSTRSRNKALAKDFQDFVLSADGKKLLRKWGFLP